MTKLFARFGGMGFAELQEVDPREFRAFAVEFGDVVRSLPFQLPENFLLIVRAMSLTSGMCSSLDPAFNIWNAVEPYSAQLIRDERGNIVQGLAEQARVGCGPDRATSPAGRQPHRSHRRGTVTVQTPQLDRRLPASSEVFARPSRRSFSPHCSSAASCFVPTTSYSELF